MMGLHELHHKFYHYLRFNHLLFVLDNEFVDQPAEISLYTNPAKFRWTKRRAISVSAYAYTLTAVEHLVDHTSDVSSSLCIGSQ